MKPIMIVVANSVRARIFTADTAHSELQEVADMAHVEGRLHDQDLTTDVSGKAAGRSGVGHAYTAPTDPKQHELSEFARRVATYVEDARRNNRLSNLILVAAPTVLGELRAHLSTGTKNQITYELRKNFTDHTPADIRSYLPNPLPVT